MADRMDVDFVLFETPRCAYGQHLLDQGGDSIYSVQDDVAVLAHARIVGMPRSQQLRPHP